MGALWRVGLRARGYAGILVGLTWIFSALWVGIGAGIHKDYETPTPVRTNFDSSSFRPGQPILTSDIIR